MITIVRPAPLLTVQDRGRFGYLAEGITRSGPLDTLALDVANALVGNDANAAVLEGCLGGAVIRCDTSSTFAFAGAELTLRLNDVPLTTHAAHLAAPGDTITVERIDRGAVWYIAFSGGIDVPLVLGSRSTLLSAGLGGLDGGPIKPGRSLAFAAAVNGPVLKNPVPQALRAALNDASIPLCAGPRSDALTDNEWAAFFGEMWTVSHAVSRVGYRLQGPTLPSRLSAELASEPACAGAMQLPPEGQPIVLMADHPTIGGYPMIGAVPAHALGVLAQRAPGATVRFVRESAEDASAAHIEQRRALLQWVSRG